MIPSKRAKVPILLAALALGAGCESNLLGQLGETYCPPGQSCVDMATGGGGGGGEQCDPNATSGDNVCKKDGGNGGNGGDGGGDDGGGGDGGNGGSGADMRPAGPVNKAVKLGSAPGTTPFEYRADGSARIRLNSDDHIVLDTQGLTLRPKPFIWIANSGNGTESKIDTKTFKQVARYCTYPGCNGDPSRSTVGLSGNVLVANRASYYGVNAPDRASAVLIAADKKDCKDRNGNGVIDTYEGEGEVPMAFRWQVGQANSPDECVLWLTHLTKDRTGATVSTLPRAAAFDAIIDDATGGLKEFVYVGLFNTQETVRLNAATGQIVNYIYHPGNSPYGAVIDKDGNLWLRNSNNTAGASLTRIEIRNGDTVTNFAPSSPCPYGISADSRGYIYTAGSTCVSRFNPANPGAGWESVGFPGPACFSRGLGLDSKFNLWVADTCAGIFHVNAANNFGGGMSVIRLTSPRGTGEPLYYLGVGIDVDEHPWVVSEGRGGGGLGSPPGGTSMVYHINPVTYASDAVATGMNSYTYSDMTGAQLRIAGSPTGIYRQAAQSDCPGTSRWTSFSWDISAAAGSEVKLRLRGATTPDALKVASFTDVTTIPGGSSPPYAMTLPDNTPYIEVEARMKSNSVNLTPVIRALTFNYTCL